MQFGSKKGILTLLIGDIFLFAAALWLTLVSRSFEFPAGDVFISNLIPFSLVFIVWLLVFFIADLYGRQAMLFRRRLPQTIFNALLINSGLAIIFFYFLPYFGVTPKTILFIDLIWSFVLIYGWRRFIVPLLLRGRRERIYFACNGKEVDELKEEIKNNPQYNSTVAEGDISDLGRSHVTMVVINPYDNNEGTIKDFYQLIFKGMRFMSVDDLYEEIFERVPLSMIDERWFLENVTDQSKPAYDFLKRLMDLVSAIIIGLISLIFYPFVYLAIKLDDGGDVFITQKRIGQGNKTFNHYKFRTMTGNEPGKWLAEGTLKVTRIGQFLRKTRIDELPQLLNVLRGDVSLIGPRPDIMGLDKRLSEEIPYYSSRTMVPPGLSGWALIKQEKPPQSVEETRIRLSYDLYYIKNRSFFLDLKIFLYTIRILLYRNGGVTVRKS